MSTDVRTTCPYCGVGCGVVATSDGQGGAGIRGDADHPANLGRLCSKGTALGETLGNHGRLLYPEMGGHRVTWDAALDRVADRFRAAIRDHGPTSVALYVSGQLLTEDYYAANKLAKAVLGTANIDSNSRLCMASAVAAHRRSFGEDLVPGVYADLELADLVVLVGSNLAWCHPVLHQRLLAARAARPGMRIVVIDPRWTATCEGADQHLPLRPGTDVALFRGLLAQLGGDGPDVAAVAAECGLDSAELTAFYNAWRDTPRVVTLFSQGVNQSAQGTDKANAIINCHVQTGRIGLPGAGPFSITGQPNAMGGREVGALSNTLAAHLDWDRPGDLDRLARFWNTAALPAAPGLKAVQLMDAVGAGQIKALWIIGTNPAVSLPEAARVRRALARCDLLVVSQCVPSDTAELAHIRLPSLAWGEKDGTVTNSERVISRQRTFLSPPGEARPDWQALAGVAARLGRADAFAWAGPRDIFAEHAQLSGYDNDGARVFDISGLAGVDYDAMEPTRWPAPARGARPERIVVRGDTPSGPARIVPTPPRPPAQPATAEFPFILMTGRVRDQWHTMTRTGRTPRLFQHWPEPTVTIHPDDAPANGSLLRVTGAEGEAVLRVRHDTGQRLGTLFAPMHWTARFCNAARVNNATGAATDPTSGQPDLKHAPVRIAPYNATWHGYVISRAEPPADLAEWCALIPLGIGAIAGWRAELAGTGDPATAAARIEAWGAGPGTWLRLQDSSAGLLRLARVDAGRLNLVVFMGPTHVLPPREWLAGLIQNDTLTLLERRSLLAGRPASGPAPEPSICVCHGVGATTIADAVRAGCDTVDDIGSRTRAGTGCGSCRPEISRILAHVMVPA